MLNAASNINELAPLLIIVAGVYRLNVSAVIFGVICAVGYHVDFGDHNYNWYYIFCGGVNYLAFKMVSNLKTPDYNLMLTIYLFIYINLLGWFNWMRYISGDLYTILCAINYAFITFLIIGGRNGAFQLDFRRYFFHIPDSAGLHYFSGAEKEERV